MRGVARSRRVRTWALWLLTAQILPGGYFAFQWCVTRFDRDSAEKLTARVGGIEKAVGVVPTRKL